MCCVQGETNFQAKNLCVQKLSEPCRSSFWFKQIIYFFLRKHTSCSYPTRLWLAYHELPWIVPFTSHKNQLPDMEQPQGDAVKWNLLFVSVHLHARTWSDPKNFRPAWLKIWCSYPRILTANQTYWLNCTSSAITACYTLIFGRPE